MALPHYTCVKVARASFLYLRIWRGTGMWRVYAISYENHCARSKI